MISNTRFERLVSFHPTALVAVVVITLLSLLVALPGTAATTQDSISIEPTEPEIYKVYLQEPEPEADELMDAVDVESELVRQEDQTAESEELARETAVANTGIVTETSSEATASTDTSGLRSIGAASVTFPPTPPEVQLLRIAPPAYADGISALAGPGRLSAREISNLVLSQSGSILSGGRASDMVWQWGQFVDHDIDLTESDGTEPEPIAVPLGDPFFDPFGVGGQVIPFTRSSFDSTTGTSISNPRQQINQITTFLDASNVYGSDAVRAAALRTNDGTGRLDTSPGDFLPFNTGGFPNAGGPDPTLFLAGDIRANEQVVLSSMHNLWVREHNFWANRLKTGNPAMTGDDIYEAARNVVMAEMQVITYQEFLPVILGSGAIPAYTGYNPSVNPGIANVFSTAAYRLGHTMLSATVLRLDSDGNPITAGPLALRDAFFAPTELTSVDVDPYMMGLASQVMQRIDSKVVDDVRNFLFGPPGAGGLDLASLNIQRGRDHGLPDYNTFRIAYGLAPAASFADITIDTTVQGQLAAAYGNVNDIDVWVGALAEDHLPGTLVGELLHATLVDQFTRLRDGDPDWYQNRLNPGAARAIENQTLAKVIARNTLLLRSDLQHNVFVVP